MPSAIDDLMTRDAGRLRDASDLHFSNPGDSRTLDVLNLFLQSSNDSLAVHENGRLSIAVAETDAKLRDGHTVPEPVPITRIDLILVELGAELRNAEDLHFSYPEPFYADHETIFLAMLRESNAILNIYEHDELRATVNESERRLAAVSR